MHKQSMKYIKMLTEFKKKVRKIEYLKYTLDSLIYWDKITYMPVNGIGYRSQVMKFLAEELYKSLSDSKIKKYLQYFDGNKSNDEIVNGMVARIKKNNAYVNKIPETEYGQYIALIAKSEQVWEQAKLNNDFQHFSPYLEKIVEHFRDFAKYWGYKENPYDALIGYYEDGLTVKEIDKLSSELRGFIIEILNQIRQKKEVVSNDSLDNISLDIEKQKELSEWILSVIGFDFNSGRLDEGAHPTTLASSPEDVRIVTSFDEKNIKTGIFNTLHEGGKGLYEQDIDKNLMGTLLAEVASFGVEEAIGRFYENIIGRSKGFSDCICNKLEELCPELKNLDSEGFYKNINKVESSLIRIDADELTYTLHIIIRYELEKELINGQLQVRELPEAWNKKYKDYLGIEPVEHGKGVLQDIQWAAGYFGFFPSYFLANIMSAQFKAMMEEQIGSLDELISLGKIEKVHQWLAENVHKRGAIYSTSELINKITGGGLSSKYYIEYLRKKYYEVYDL